MEPAGIPHLSPATPPDAPMHRDPDFTRAADWLAAEVTEPRALVVGAPYAGASISGARCDLSPAAIRRALTRFSTWSSDWAVSLDRLPVLDAGDIEPVDAPGAMQDRVEAAVRALRGAADVPIVLLGGDNSVTVGGARGADADGLLTFDAHHDCRDPAHGITNGSPVRQLVEGGVAHVVQIGVHGFANAEANARWALDHKVHGIGVTHVRGEGVARVLEGAFRMLGDATRIWADFDLDVLERALAPGAPAALPGGLWPMELEHAAFMLGKNPRVVGIDLTEIDPSADVADATVRAAAAVLLSYLAGVASR